MVKNPPGMHESPVRFLGWGDPLEKGLGYPLQYSWASLVAQVVKSPPGIARDESSIPRLGRSPGGGHGDSLQYSCLENPMDEESGGLPSMGSHRIRHN